MGASFRDFTDIRKDGQPRRHVAFAGESLELKEIARQRSRGNDGCAISPSCLTCHEPECIWVVPRADRMWLAALYGIKFNRRDK